MKKRKDFILEIKKKNLNELKNILLYFIKNIFILRIKLVTKKNNNTSKLKKIRKNIARIKTFIKIKND